MFKKYFVFEDFGEGFVFLSDAGPETVEEFITFVISDGSLTAAEFFESKGFYYKELYDSITDGHASSYAIIEKIGYDASFCINDFDL